MLQCCNAAVLGAMLLCLKQCYSVWSHAVVLKATLKAILQCWEQCSTAVSNAAVPGKQCCNAAVLGAMLLCLKQCYSVGSNAVVPGAMLQCWEQRCSDGMVAVL